MQCSSALKRPLRDIIKSIGFVDFTAPRRQLAGTSTRFHQLEHSRTRCFRPHHCAARCEYDEGLHIEGGQPSEYHEPGQNSSSGERLRKRRAARSTRAYSTATAAQQPREDDSLSLHPVAAQTHDCSGRDIALETGDSPFALSSVNERAESVSGHTRQARMEGLRRVQSPSRARRHDAEKSDKTGFRYVKAQKTALESKRKRLARLYEIQSERREKPGQGDWRRVLQLLDVHTPAGEDLYRKKVEIVKLPPGIAAVFRDTASVAILEIMQRSGSHVQTVSQTTHQTSSIAHDTFSSLGLLGTTAENDAAIEILPEYVDYITDHSVDPALDLSAVLTQHRGVDDAVSGELDLSSSPALKEDYFVWAVNNPVETAETSATPRPVRTAENQATPRPVWSQDRSRRPSSIRHHLTPPAKHTPLALTEYITRLTQSVPRLSARKYYQTRSAGLPKDRIQDVTEKLLALFTDVVATRVVPSAAVDRAFAFFFRHDNTAAFREAFRNLKSGGYNFTPSNYSILLAAAGKAGHVQNFWYITKLMLRDGVSPNPQVWTCLHDLVCRRFPLQAAEVVKAMRRKGLLASNDAAHFLVMNSVGRDLSILLSSGKSLMHLIGQYDVLYKAGKLRATFEWLTVDVANRLIDVLLQHGKVHDAWSVLHELRKRHATVSLKTSTLNTFLTSALRDPDASMAVAWFKRFRIGQLGALAPDHVTYKILFSIAWQRRYYNMLRVVWRYACADGHVDYLMQTRVWNSLSSRKHDSTRGQLWFMLAGKFVVGVDLDIKQEYLLGTATNSVHEQLQHFLRNDRLQELSFPPMGEVHRERLHEVAAALSLRSASEQTDKQRFVKMYKTPDTTAYNQGICEDVCRASVRGLLHDKRYLPGLQHMMTSDLEGTRYTPVRPLAEVLEEALKLDVEWKESGLGTPRALTMHTVEDMLIRMLEEGIEVVMDSEQAPDDAHAIRQNM